MKKPFKFCGETIFPEKVTGFRIKPQRQNDDFDVPSYIDVTFLFDGDVSSTVAYKFKSKAIDAEAQSLEELKTLIDDRKTAQQSLEDREKEIEYAKSYAEYLNGTVSSISKYASEIVKASEKYEKEIIEWYNNKRKTNIPSYRRPSVSEYNLKNVITFEEYRLNEKRAEFRSKSTLDYNSTFERYKNSWDRFATKSEKEQVKKIWENINSALSAKCSQVENILLKEFAGCTLSEITVYTDES